MPRPSRSLDRKLITTAGAMLPRAGVSGLSVREVARRAGVNLGMFYYHFKTKDAFVRRVLQETYEHFFVTFREAARVRGAPTRRLRSVLVAFARFARDHRTFYALLARELLNGQPECRAFVRENFPRHAAILVGLLDECKGRRLIRPLPTPVLAAFAMSAMGIPNVLVATLERARPRSVGGVHFAAFRRLLLSDETIEARADMVLAGLARRRNR